MLRYNRARRTEWVEAQKVLEADEVATARLAYLKGEATEEQIQLVEEANREAEAKGEKLPPLLSAPEHRTHFEEHIKPTFQSDDSSSSSSTVAEEKKGKGVLGIFSGLLAKEEQGDDVGSSQERLGYESLSEEDDVMGMRKSDMVRSVEDKAAYVQEKAKEKWQQEKDNQRRGGSLDKLGLETAGVPKQSQEPAKKGWWPW